MWVTQYAHRVSWRPRWRAKEYRAYQTNRSGSRGISVASISWPSPGPTILMFRLAYRVVLHGLGLDVWNTRCAPSTPQCCLLLGSLWTTIPPSHRRLDSPFLRLARSPLPLAQNAETHTDRRCRYANDRISPWMKHCLGRLAQRYGSDTPRWSFWQTWTCRWLIKRFMLSKRCHIRVTKIPLIMCRIVLAKCSAVQCNVVKELQLNKMLHLHVMIGSCTGGHTCEYLSSICDKIYCRYHMHTHMLLGRWASLYVYYIPW